MSCGDGGGGVGGGGGGGQEMFHVPYDVPLYCCAGLKMVLPQIEEDYFKFEANDYALCDDNLRKLKKCSKC